MTADAGLFDALRGVTLFVDADDAAVSALASSLRLDHHARGDVIVHQGTEADSFAIVLEGSVRVSRRGTDGRVVWAHAVGPGEIIGELALLSGSDRTATITAATPVRLATGDREAFVETLRLPGVSARVRKEAAQRLAAHAVPVTTTVKDDTRIWLRPLLPSDRDELGDAIRSLSAQSLRMRFFTGAGLPDSVIDHLTDLDYVNHFALVAGLDATGDGIGVVRIIRDPVDATRAELAVAVADDQQGLGVGSTLVGAIGATASILGIDVLDAEVLRENRPMRALLDRLGATWTLVDAGVVATEIAVARARSLISGSLADDIEAVASATLAATSTAPPSSDGTGTGSHGDGGPPARMGR